MIVLAEELPVPLMADMGTSQDQVLEMSEANDVMLTFVDRVSTLPAASVTTSVVPATNVSLPRPPT